MSMMVSFVLSFFPRDVLDEILNLIESVSEDFPSYSYSLIRRSGSLLYVNLSASFNTLLYGKTIFSNFRIVTAFTTVQIFRSFNSN